MAILVMVGCTANEPEQASGPPEAEIIPATLTAIPPTSTPEPTPTPTPPAAAACENPLYPLLVDNQWVYRTSAEGETTELSISVSETDDQAAKLNILFSDSGVVTDSGVQCQEGAILNFPTTGLAFILGGVDGGLDLEYISGVFAPAEADFIAKNWIHEWETAYVANGEFSFEDEGDKLTATVIDTPVNMHWTADGTRETITVAGGTFTDATKIRREMIMELTMTLESEGDQETIETTLTIYTTQWYALGTGLIKQQADRASVTLFGAKFPIEVEGSMELVAFYPAP